MHRPQPYEENRPWGSFRRFTLNELSTVKLLTVAKGEANSLQSHNKRHEFWRVVTGELDLTIGGTIHRARVGDEFWIPPQTQHRLAGVGDANCVLEISYGTFDEDDIIRYEDRYGRS